MLNIVIPMAGAGTRFVKAGYTVPKPFIDVRGKPMIERVLENLSVKDSRFILIMRKDHLTAQSTMVESLLRRFPCEIITIDQLTEGAACTILLAARLINNDEPLLLANSDQIVEMDVNDFLKDSRKRELDGSILTFFSNHPKWSYASVDGKGYVQEVREKIPISSHATVGLYYFERGRDFVNSAALMITNNDRVNNEFYTAPVYNYAIKARARIGIYEIEARQMFGLGTPEDLVNYINHLAVSRQ